MKTIFKIFKSIRILVILMLLLPSYIIGQDFPFDMAGGDTTIPVTAYEIGDMSYSVTISPQTPDSEITWQIFDPSELDDTGLQMSVNGAPLVGTTPNITVNGSNEVITITVDPMGVPVAEPLGYEVILSASDDTHGEVEIIVNIPVILPVRDPVSVVMVLDRSGSMEWELDSDNDAVDPFRRWDYLESGVTAFGSQLAAPGMTLPEDQFGIVYYESSTSIEALGPINTTLSGSPNGFTAMGEGLFQARLMLDGATPGNRKVILLFTDGYQNAGRLVQADGQTIGVDPDQEDINPGDEIEIYPIAVISPGDANPILQTIANFNNDDEAALFLNGVVSTATIEDYFMNHLETILQDSSPQLIETKGGTFDSEGFAEETFTVNDKLSQLYFYIKVTDTLGTNASFTKDGQQIPFSTASSQNGLSHYTIEFPPRSPNGGVVPGLENVSSGGDWRVQFAASKGQTYKIGAIGNDHNLNINYDTQSTYKIGNPITTTVTIDLLGNPITDADNVLWTVLKPGTDLNDLLARTNVDLSMIDGPDAGSTGLQKYYHLLENNPEFVQSLIESENLIELTNNGDGTYTGNFADTDVTGVYQLIYSIRGNHSQIGKYVRTYYRGAAFSFDTIDEDVSEQSSSTTPTGITLTYRPAYSIDGVVRYVGAAFNNSINFTGSGLTVQDIIDNGDGSYDIVLLGNPDSDIQISLLGEEVYNGKASSFGKRNGFIDKIIDWIKDTLGIPAWLAWLLLILLIILIIWLIRKLLK